MADARRAPPVAFDNETYWIERHAALRGAIAAVGDIRKDEVENTKAYAEKKIRLANLLRGMGRYDFTGAEVLDAGCGTGLMSEVFFLFGAKVTGIDASQDAVEVARARCGDANFVVGSLVEFAFPSPFDIVFCSDVLYHIVDDKNWVAVVGNLARCVKDGGHLIIVDHVRPEPHSPAPHVRFRTRAMYSELLASFELKDATPSKQGYFIVYRRDDLPQSQPRRHESGWRPAASRPVL